MWRLFKNSRAPSARVKTDLEILRKEFMPELSAITAGGGTDYPARARISHEDFAKGLSKLARAINYPNFKNEVAAKNGRGRARVYSRVWSTLLELESGRVGE